MGLFDFFRINLPYGIRKDKSGNWAAFNREYCPLGYNTTERTKQLNCKLIFSSYKNITDSKLKKFFSEEDIQYDENQNIETIFFYNDKTNPKSNPLYWEQYFEKIKFVSQFEINREHHIGF